MAAARTELAGPFRTAALESHDLRDEQASSVSNWRGALTRIQPALQVLMNDELVRNFYANDAAKALQLSAADVAALQGR